MSKEDIMLYWASGSPYCMSVMMALEEKGLKGYGNKLISFQDNEHKSPEILKLNNRGQVPTFRHGTVVVNESMAICDYLEAKFKNKGTQLLPNDPNQLALVRQRQYESSNLVTKLVKDVIFPSFSPNVDQEKMKTAKVSLSKELGIWDGYLKEQGPDSYLAGKYFTMADVAAYPFLTLGVRFGLRLRPRMPFLASYYERVSDRKSVKDSWPPHWKGTPGKDLLNDVLD